jgi:hypothetical protein
MMRRSRLGFPIYRSVEFNKEVEIMRTLLATLVLVFALGCADLVLGVEIQLPAIGTNVNYNYATSSPELDVFTNAAPANVWQNELTFADGRQLFVEFENVPPTPHAMLVEVQLHGTGLNSLFEPLLIPFDEQLTLITDGGTTIEVPKNTGIGYYDDDPDYYSFSWTVEPPEHNFLISALRWNISPDLLSGATLPSTLDAQISLFANGAIRVVPEPGPVGGLVALSFLLRTRRRRF